MAGIRPWQYRPGKSYLHRLPAGLKLLCFLGISLAALVPRDLFLLVPAGVLVAAALAAGIRPDRLVRGSRPLAVLALMVLLFRSVEAGGGEKWFPPAFSLSGLFLGCRYAGMLFVTYAAGSLFFSVTTTTEIRESLEALEAFFAGPPKPGRPRPSLGISLMLGFIPRFFELWENANLACEARAGKRGIRRLITLIPLVTERMMRLAAETAWAMESRGF